VIFINQIRMQIGVMFGNPETTAGGNALKFYASVRLDIRRIQTHQGRRDGGRQPHQGQGREEQGRRRRSARPSSTSSTTRASRARASSSTSPWTRASSNKAGTWFSFGDERLGQGRENTRLFLREHADIRAKIEAKLFPLLGLKVAGASVNGTTTNGAASR
jgi:recombination protein RecA